MRAAILLLLALPAAGAASTNVTLLRDGAPVSGGEMCRFPAGDQENPFKRWLASQDLTCAAAGSMTFPPGKWSVFGRLDGTSVSAAPVVIDGASAPETLSLPLVPAATLAPLLPDGLAGVVYAPRLGSAFPVAAGMARVSVPAGEELWLLVVKTSLPIAVIPVAALDAGTERAVSAQSGGGSFVIGWLYVAESDREVLNKGNASPPHVRLTSGGPSRDSYPLPPLAVLHGAFVFVRAESAGEATLDVGGRGWLPDRRRVKVAQAVSVAEEPLHVRPACTVIVNWSAEAGLPALERSIGSCEKKDDPSPQFEISLSSCAPPKNPREPVDPAACQTIRKQTFTPNPDFGSVTLDDIPSGTYRAELRCGKLPPVSAMVTALPMKQVTVPLHAAYLQLYGSLTFGDKPLGKDAILQFGRGGIGFASRDTGEYRAALLMPIDVDSQINVASCGEGPKALVFADQPSRGKNSRFDINIPDNVLTVTVTDTFTRAPIAGAQVIYVVNSLRVPRRPIATRNLMTKGGDARQPGEDAGTVEIKSVPEREIRLYVKHSGYQDYAADPFSMLKDEKKNVDVQLVPLRGSEGKILSQNPFENATIFWFTSAGTQSEHADVGPDGTFIFASAHGPDETMAVVSRSHPLWVVRSPDTSSGTRGKPFEVRFPDGQARSLEVSIRGANPRSITHIGLVIGGVLVPPPALRLHQSLRNSPATLSGPTPLPIRDLAETGTIDVILGPMVERYVMPDQILLRRFATAPRKRLAPGATAVVFEP
ncbi:MAG TPA: hypothetical protein VN380_26350 [Thermoanaerobaculia bacterium]|jgi:hypothetical protein|nr:hypothetical protein [Thermoanaerobaculia bacterium]